VDFRGIGTLVNVATVLVGGLAGLLLGNRLPQRMVDITMQTVGLATTLVGLQMAWGADSGPSFIAVLLSLVIGSWAGEALRLDDRLNAFGERLRRRFGQRSRGNFVRGYVTASLLFCVGPMAVLGALQDGLRGDPTLLLTKSTLDGISAIALAAGLGPGVLFSVLTVAIYQGALTAGAGAASTLLTDPVVALVTATGGLIIVGLGLNILGIAKLRVANMLPALLVAAAAALALGSRLA
jgi:uncharacterized membrane protein YqgA involved in biofilm formation